MISFVVAAYNRPGDLRVLLSSIAAQSSGAWEVLVMDEGDNGDVVRWFADPRMRHYQVERVTIAADGRGTLGLLPKHTGAALSRGEHLCFPSDDIYYFPKFVEYMNGHPEDVVGCDMFVNYTFGINALRFKPQVGDADCANYVIRPAAYARHPFTEFIPEDMGTADGLCVQRCVEDGASWRYVSRFLAVHGGERP